MTESAIKALRVTRGKANSGCTGARLSCRENLREALETSDAEVKLEIQELLRLSQTGETAWAKEETCRNEID
jgi:PBP1b-binding outer membrane lipoprotein LpoB